MNHEDAWVPTRTQRWTAVAGLLTLVLGAPIALAIFASSTLPWVLGVWVPLGLVLAVGPVVRRINARRFPVTLFGIDDVSGPASQIEDAKSRLARGDYAAFTINAIRNPNEPDAGGQIWAYADKVGGIEKTAIELNFESSAEPAEHPALTRLLAEGWEISSWEPDHWVLLTLYSDVDASVAIRQLAGAVAGLFNLPDSTQWTLRAFA